MDVKKNHKEQSTEVSKNECDVLKQMAKYQFDEPLKVTLILEESDTEDHERSIEDSVKTKDKNSNVTSETIFGSQILHQASYLNSRNLTIDNTHTRIIQNTNQLVSYESNKVDEKLLSIERKEMTILLDSLSENIIRIIQISYETYNNNYKNDRLMFEKAKNNYLQFKNNVFKKSYAITKSIILPREQNYVFIEKFIRRTLEIANNIISYPREFLRELLVNIIMELINWTKLKVLETSKTLTKLDHNSPISTMNMAPINTKQLNNSNCMCYNCIFTTGGYHRNMHTINDHPINKPHGVINKLPIKKNAYNIPVEENSIVASKRQKVTCNKRYYKNISQTATQSYTIDSELVHNNSNLNIDHQSSALRSVSRDSGIGSPICTNWPSDEMRMDWNAHVPNVGGFNNNTMEQQKFSNDDDFVLERMKKIQFNRPISVTVILEEPNVDHHESVDSLLKKVNQNQSSTNYVNNTSKEPSAIYYSYDNSSINTENEEFRDISYMNNKLHCNDSVHPKTSSLSNGENIRSSLPTLDTRKLIMSLDRISDNILLLANYTWSLHNTYKNNPFKYKKALEEFSQRRYDIFKSSYTTINRIIIPLENRYSVFIQKFINRTVAIAQSKSWHYIEEKLVVVITLDLIKWTKDQNKAWKRSQRWQKINTSTSCNSLLSTNTTTTGANNVCIFSHGSPGQEITINIDSQVLNNFLSESNSNIGTTKITKNSHQANMDKNNRIKSNENQAMQEQSNNNKISTRNKRRRCQTLSNISPYYDPLSYFIQNGNQIKINTCKNLNKGFIAAQSVPDKK